MVANGYIPRIAKWIADFRTRRLRDAARADAIAHGMDRPLAPVPAWRRILPYVAGTVLIVGLAMLLLARTGGHVYRVPVDRLTFGVVTIGPFEDFIGVRGAVAPFSTDHLTTDEGGTIKSVLVEDGAVVKTGQPLIVLENAALQLQIASREADTAGQISALENTELQLEERRFKYQHDLLDIEHAISKLKGELARDKVLLDGDAIAPAIYKEEQEEYAYELKLQVATIASRDTEQRVRSAQLAQLRETLARLKANVAVARASLEALQIRAPMDGQLAALDAEVGQSKARGAVLGEIDSLNHFKLSAQVDEFYLGRILLGQEALFNIDGRNYKASIAKIYPQVANGAFKVDLYFTGDTPQGIHNGEAVDLKLELGGASRAMMLPSGPFYQDTGGNWLFVVSPDGGSADRRSVRLGRRTPEYIEVLDGLKPGEKVIISGYEAFDKMDRIAFEEPDNRDSQS
jgi:HlyD family secretion protein